MADNRTRIFKGTYTSKDGKIDNLNVRIYKRFASLILAISLEQGSYGTVLNSH